MEGVRPERSLDPMGGAAGSKIIPLSKGDGISGKHKEDAWVRPPSKTGNGATHVKTFHAKLNNEAMGFLDEQINKWLDAHPECEVKMVNTVVGDWMGATREQHVIVQVWV